jgi:hypothetical protein
MLDLLLIECVTKMKAGSNAVEDHPQLNHNGHPVDGALGSASSTWHHFLSQNSEYWKIISRSPCTYSMMFQLMTSSLRGGNQVTHPPVVGITV